MNIESLQTKLYQAIYHSTLAASTLIIHIFPQMLKILIDAQGLRLIIGERSENICSSSVVGGALREKGKDRMKLGLPPTLLEKRTSMSPYNFVL